jgi:CHAT domain-containing protein/Tfp pilus assembly protein PilF
VERAIVESPKARERRRRLPLLAALLVAASCAPAGDRAAPSGPSAPPAPTATTVAQAPLAPGDPRAHAIDGGTRHRHPIRLAAGEALHAVVEQRGIDVTLFLLDPTGRRLVEVDGFNGSRGEEHVFWVAAGTGVHRLEVRPWSDRTHGEYTIRLAPPRPATPADRLRAQALHEVAMAQAAGDDDGGRRAARRHLRRAMRLWREAGEPYFQALAAVRFARIEAVSGDLRTAETLYRRALRVLRTENAEADLPPVLNELGDLLRRRGQGAEAQRLLEEALAHSRRLGKRREEAVALNNLAVLLRTRGEAWRALDAYEGALLTFRALGDDASATTALLNLGRLYNWLGQSPEALDALREAEALDRRNGGRRAAEILTSLGWVEVWAGRSEEARRLLEEALALTGQAPRSRATTLDRLGTASLHAGRPRAARRAYAEALALTRRLGDTDSTAHLLANLGKALLATGELDEARRHFEAALRLAPAGGDPSGRAHMLLGHAETLRRAGDPAGAQSALAQAVPLVESLRHAIDGADMRSHYLATVHEIFAALVDLSMELHAADPAAGWDRRALEVVERSRARSLLERASREAFVSPEERRQLDGLERQIAACERQLRSARGAGDEATAAALAAELRGLLGRRDRRASAVDTVGAAPPREHVHLTLEEIRRELLDEETALLVYFLGERRSFAWLVTRDRVVSRVLPPRHEIETGARRLRSLLTRRPHAAHEAQTALTASALSSAILAPLAADLEARRLLVMADGALQSIPLGLLPHAAGGEPEMPLLARHEIVSVPSASVQVALERRAAARPPAADHLALIAVPEVRQGTAPQLDRNSASAAGLERSVGELGLERLPPLPHVRAEADAIFRIAAGARVWRPTEGEASIGEVRRRAGEHRILHFATHALIHGEHPELSGVVLADGFLQSYEIAGLDLRADLVVLSACSTAVGEEVWGEGVLGLPRSFLAAGAGGVVVTLWNVDDEATAELMQHFYAAMIRDGLSPAAALRRAQLEIHRQPRWRAPYFWAPFSLVGGASTSRRPTAASPFFRSR